MSQREVKKFLEDKAHTGEYFSSGQIERALKNLGIEVCRSGLMRHLRQLSKYEFIEKKQKDYREYQYRYTPQENKQKHSA